VSSIKFLTIIFFAASLSSLYGQCSAVPGLTVTGELRSRGDMGANTFLVELYDVRSNAMVERVPVSQGQFQLDHVPTGGYSVRLVTAPGEAPIVEEYHEFQPGGAPLVLDLPERNEVRPISGVVSLRELEHPIPKKAMKKAYEAEKYARAKNFPKAIANLEEAIRIDPSYRDAHLNLGVQYARVGRTADARAEFQKALEIGPPAAPIYVDLAITSVALRRYGEAETLARKALELDPANSSAQLLLQRASSR
jgi:TPR repeat/Tetratricopeptide repeat